MGYYTHYQLDTDDDMNRCPTCGTAGVIDHQVGIEEMIGYDPFGGECKWYKYEEEMKAYSKKYPNVTFILDGEGEESGDIWRAWFKNGKHYREDAKVQIAEFDPEKME
jgi:hypothetical protein